jgi:hypothetical protein
MQMTQQVQELEQAKCVALCLLIVVYLLQLGAIWLVLLQASGSF